MTKKEKRNYEKLWYTTIGKKKREEANKRWQEKNYKAFQEYKATLKCEECGENHPACLDFHHIDPETKSFSVGEKAGRKPFKVLLEEIKKCRVLCANCHRKLHHAS